MIVSVVQTPAKIIMTQNIQFQDKSLAATYPPTIGPNTGPKKVLAANKLVAGPRPSADHISAITPPAIVRGATPKRPPKKRQIRSVSILVASACPKKKIV